MRRPVETALFTSVDFTKVLKDAEMAYIFGAVCPDRGVAAGLVMPFADTGAMNDHLAEIARTVALGAHAVLLLDGAGWHRGHALVVPENVSLVVLPPYSPELNPVENVWQYLRANWLAISVFDHNDAIVDACCDAWNRFAERGPGSRPGTCGRGRWSAAGRGSSRTPSGLAPGLRSFGAEISPQG